MIYVLVANKNKEEGNSWRSRLNKSGYAVMPECLDLPALVYALAREKVHFVVCSINLIEHNAFGVINAVMKFFPRVKIIIVGNMNQTIISNILSRLSELKEEKSDVSVSDLVRIFHSTVGFLNSAVMRNGGGSIFDLFM